MSIGNRFEHVAAAAVVMAPNARVVDENVDFAEIRKDLREGALDVLFGCDVLLVGADVIAESLQVRGGFRDSVQRDIRRGDMDARRAKLAADGAADVAARACHDGYAIIEWHGLIPLFFSLFRREGGARSCVTAFIVIDCCHTSRGCCNRRRCLRRFSASVPACQVQKAMDANQFRDRCESPEHASHPSEAWLS